MKSFADTAPNSPFSWDDEISTQFGKFSFRAASIIIFVLARYQTKSLRVTPNIPLPLIAQCAASSSKAGAWSLATIISNDLQQSKAEGLPAISRWLCRQCPKCRGVLAANPVRGVLPWTYWDGSSRCHVMVPSRSGAGPNSIPEQLLFSSTLFPCLLPQWYKRPGNEMKRGFENA